MRFKKVYQTKKEHLEALLQKYISKDEVGVELLTEIVGVFRPNDVRVVYDIELTPLLEILSENHLYQNYIGNYLQRLFHKKEFDQIITDTGIIKDSDFFYEVRKRLVEKLLPYQPSEDTLQFILNQVFYSSKDPLWLERIPKNQIEELVTLIRFDSIYNTDKEGFEISEVIYAIEVLLQRLSGTAMETDVNRMVPEFQNFDSPFIAIQREFTELSNKLMSTKAKYTTSDDLSYKQIIILHKQCNTYLKTAIENSHKYGISIKVNQNILRIRQQLERVIEMLPYLVLDNPEQAKTKTIQLANSLIKYNCNKNNIRKLINESTQSLSYEVTQHSARTGEHYITNSKSEYFRMLKTASGGGLIVGFLCIFKILLSKLDASEFGYAFYYSMNYAFGFIAIYLLGFTLATKQPAMTASTLISAIERGTKDKTIGISDKYRGFAVFFARVFRSQFIAFVGNVLIAFPVAMLLIWMIDMISGNNIADQKWDKLLIDLSPVHSAAIFHAAIAGFFLFVSGLIAGSIANRDKYNRVYYRIQEHPILKKVFGVEKTKKIASLYEKKWAGISSNLWFGIFMGSTASIGIFLGLNLDIRHITFTSGNLALGLYGGHFDIPLSMLIWGILGIGMVGLTNFIVSFSLSLALAFRSRNIPILELRLVAISIWKFFKERPSLFFFPPKK
jgi:site-specific recombinase